MTGSRPMNSGNQPELDQVLGHDLAEDVAVLAIELGAQFGAEAEALLADPGLDDGVEPGERATDDEQHVRRVDLDELLVRVLAAALRRHRRGRALEDLQQRLLHALAGDVARDRRVLGLAGDLVDLVDVDDAGLGALDVVVRGLDQLEQDVLDVLADVAGLGERGGVGDRERARSAFGPASARATSCPSRSGRAAGCSTWPVRPLTRRYAAWSRCRPVLACSGCRRRRRASSWSGPGRRRSCSGTRRSRWAWAARRS